jgi:DNA-binding FadR family transcriptional regulator
MEDDNYLAHFFEMRLIIEPKMIELAVLRASDEDVKVIEEAYDKVEAAIKSGVNHMLPDIHFHNAIAKASKNPIMERIIPIINNGIEGGYTKTKDNPEVSEIVIVQHAEIMKYINERNGEEARLAMERHIQYGYSRVKNLKK